MRNFSIPFHLLFEHVSEKNFTRESRGSCISKEQRSSFFRPAAIVCRTHVQHRPRVWVHQRGCKPLTCITSSPWISVCSATTFPGNAFYSSRFLSNHSLLHFSLHILSTIDIEKLKKKNCFLFLFFRKDIDKTYFLFLLGKRCERCISRKKKKSTPAAVVAADRCNRR